MMKGRPMSYEGDCEENCSGGGISPPHHKTPQGQPGVTHQTLILKKPVFHNLRGYKCTQKENCAHRSPLNPCSQKIFTLSSWSDPRDLPPSSILPDPVQAGITSRKALRTVDRGCDLSSPWDVLSRESLGHQSTGNGQGTWALGYRTAKERKRTLPLLLLPQPCTASQGYHILSTET